MNQSGIFRILEGKSFSSLFDNSKVLQNTINYSKISFVKGEPIYFFRDNAQHFYYIVKGKIKIGNTNDEFKDVIYQILEKGEIFGESALLPSQQRHDFAEAIEDVLLYSFTNDQIQALIKKDASFSVLLLSSMSSKIDEIETRLASLIFKDSRTRIIEHLLEIAEKHGQRMGYEWSITTCIKHQEIADITSTSRQTVTVLLNELRDNDIIHFDRKRILIKDIERLKQQI